MSFINYFNLKHFLFYLAYAASFFACWNDNFSILIHFKIMISNFKEWIVENEYDLRLGIHREWIKMLFPIVK